MAQPLCPRLPESTMPRPLPWIDARIVISGHQSRSATPWVRGRVPTPGIGIVAGDERLATQLGIEGVVVVQVVPGSSAERAGLSGVDPAAGTIGDIVVGANGRPVRHLSDLTNALESVGVGGEIELTVRNDRRTRTVKAQVIDVNRP